MLPIEFMAWWDAGGDLDTSTGAADSKAGSAGAAALAGPGGRKLGRADRQVHLVEGSMRSPRIERKEPRAL